MDDAIINNSELQYLFEELRNRQINHSLRVCTAAHVQGVVDAIAKKARQLGATGLNDLRGMLRPESKSESWDNLGAAQALVILEDGASLGLVIYQAAKLWDQRLVGRLFIDFLEAARELIPHTLKTGPIHEGVIKTLLIFIENILDEGACGSIFETSAVTGHPQLKEALIKAASQSVSQGMLEGSKEDWKRRSKALFALRHYPDMQATMLEAMNHPQDDFAEAAASPSSGVPANRHTIKPCINTAD